MAAAPGGVALDDITECSICTEVFTDPRTLPCIHTYCLKCIEMWCRGKHPGNQAACPLCRKSFTIPSGGVQGLPKNFVMEKLKHLKSQTVTSKKQTPCDACTDVVTQPFKKQPAKVRCVECRRNLCDSCSRIHKKAAATCSHRCLPIEDEDAVGTPPVCDKHRNKNLELYCTRCKVPVCAVCFIESHKLHKCIDIDDVAQDFKALLLSNSKSMTVCASKWRQKLSELQKCKQDFLDCTAKAEIDIRDHTTLLKQIIEQQEQSSLASVAAMKTFRMEEFRTMIDKIEQQLVLMESLQIFCDEVCRKGSSGNIVKDANSLQTRATELMKWEMIEKELQKMSTMRVTFAPSDVLKRSVDDAFGKVLYEITGTVGGVSSPQRKAGGNGGVPDEAGNGRTSGRRRGRGRMNRNDCSPSVRCYNCGAIGHMKSTCPAASPLKARDNVCSDSECSYDSRGSSSDLYGCDPNDSDGGSAQVTCYRCGLRGHYASYCPSMRCYRCNQMGHSSRVCLNA